MDADYDGNGLFPLTAADLRQYVYCPRVVYYRHCVSVRPPATYKMVEGRLQHERVAELEERRGLRAYGLSDGERLFDVRLASKSLGLTGIVDMVILRRHEVLPVEFKHVEAKLKQSRPKRGPRWLSDREEPAQAGDEAADEDGDNERAKLVVPLHHKYQLAAYAMMAEERWRLPARRCFVHFLASNAKARAKGREGVVEARAASAVLISDGVRRHTRRLLAEMRAMIIAQRMPAGTRRLGRCVECEYRRFCNDVDVR